MEKLHKNSFIFYRNFRDCLRKKSAKVRLEVLESVINYALDDEIPDNLSDDAEGLFLLIQSALDANNQKSKGGRYGHLGGRPKSKNKNPMGFEEENPMGYENRENKNPMGYENRENKNPMGYENCEKDCAKENPMGYKEEKEKAPIKENTPTPLKENIPEKEKEEKEKDIDKSISKKKNFAKPTIEEVAAYCRERRNSIDAHTFWNFYESKGWRVGNQPMKDWRAAVRTWEHKQGKSQNIRQCTYVSLPDDYEADRKTGFQV